VNPRFNVFAMITVCGAIFALPALSGHAPVMGGTTVSPAGFPYGSSTDKNPEGPQPGCFNFQGCQTQFTITTTNGTGGSTSNTFNCIPVNAAQPTAITSHTSGSGYQDSGDYCGDYFVAVPGPNGTTVQDKEYCGYDLTGGSCG
jgi:hypothetical protein